MRLKRRPKLFPAEYEGHCASCGSWYDVEDSIGWIWDEYQKPVCEECHAEHYDNEGYV